MEALALGADRWEISNPRSALLFFAESLLHGPRSSCSVESQRAPGREGSEGRDEETRLKRRKEGSARRGG